MTSNTNLERILPIYIERFKQDFEEPGEDTGRDEKQVSNKVEWLKREMQDVFSKDTIDSPDKERVIQILCGLFSTEDGGDDTRLDSPKNIILAENLYSQNFIDSVKDLLFGDDEISVRYSRFMKETGVTRSIASELLAYFYPDKYAINNPFSEKALAFLGYEYEEVTDSGKQTGNKYVEYCGKAAEVLKLLRKDPVFQDADFVTLDDFLDSVSAANIWKVAPGEDAYMWDNGFWQENEVVSINWSGLYEDLKNDLFTADKVTIKKAVNGSDYEANQHIKFLYEFNIGDVVVANHGRTSFIGYGIVTSDPKYLKDSDGNCCLCRDVFWQKTDLNIPIPKKIGIIGKCRHTIASLSFDQFRESVLNNISENRYWIILPSGGPKKTPDYLYFWNEWKENEYIHIAFWKDFIDRFKEKALSIPDYEEYKKMYDEVYPENKQPTTLYNFMFLMKKGDHVIVNEGKKQLIGHGIVSSDAYYSEKPDQSYYHNVDWKEIDLQIPMPEDIKNKLTRKVVEITKEEYESIMGGTTGETDGKMMNALDNLLARKKQVILYGPPGTGKTYQAKHFIDQKSNHTDPQKSNTRFVTFHPSFAYEDFIEGLRPEADEDGRIHYRVVDGVFKKFAQQSFNVLLTEAGIEKEWKTGKDIPVLTEDECNTALETVHAVPFYLIIDEINRGDISRILGELITLLEADKRLCAENQLTTTLPYSKTQFGIPPNLFIIGTMNTADKSIALVDIALRRRFGFLEMMPDSNVLRNLLVSDDADVQEIFDIAIAVHEEINTSILEKYDRDHQIGHSFFVKLKDETTPEEACKSLEFVWYNEVMPLLQEYFYDSPKKLSEILGKDFVTLHSDDRSFMFTEPCHNDVFLSALKSIAKMEISSEQDEDETEDEDYRSLDD